MVKHILYLRFICLLVFVSVGLSLPAIADDGTKIPVKLNAKLATFFDGLDPAWITDPLAGLAAPFPKKDEAQLDPGYAVMLQTLNVDGRHRSKVFNCNEMLKLDAEGFIAAPEGTSLSSYNLYGRCELLNYLAKARPSKSSAISKLDFNAPDVKFHLPRMVLSPSQSYIIDRILPSWAMRVSMMDFHCVWNDDDDTLNTKYTFKQCQENKGPYPKIYKQEFSYSDITSDSAYLYVYDDLNYDLPEVDGRFARYEDSISYTLLAQGDFDGDGSEDLLMAPKCYNRRHDWCSAEYSINYTDDGIVPWGDNRVDDYHWEAPLFFILSKTEKTDIAYFANLCNLDRKLHLFANKTPSGQGRLEYYDCDDARYYMPLPRKYWPDRTLEKEDYDWTD